MNPSRALSALADRLGVSRPRVLWVAWWGVAAASILVTLAGWRMAAASHAHAATLSLRLQQLGQAPVHTPDPIQARDFALALSQAPDPSRFVAALVRAAADAGVSMTSVVVSEQAATAVNLGRLQYAMVLKGSYAGNKQVLAEVLARFSGAGVYSLRMRVDPAGHTVETIATLSLWSAPLR